MSPAAPAYRPTLLEGSTAVVAHAAQVVRRGTIEMRELPLGVPDRDEVLVEVEAAGVAYADLLLRERLRRLPLPVTPGHEVVGRVSAVGGAVTEVAVGDRVALHTLGTGGWATHVLAPGWTVVRCPEQLPADAVVALVLNYLTAWQLLHRTVALSEGSTILVHSAAGGVGTALLQLAALRQLRVIGTASAGKADVVRGLGAVPVDYRSSDLTGDLRRLAPDGIDAAFDAIGSTSWRRDLTLLRPGGHLVVYGMSTAVKDGRRDLPALLSNVIRVPRPTVLGHISRSIGVSAYSSDAMVTAHRDWYRSDLAGLLALLDAGTIDPVLHRSFDLEDASAALDELGAGRAAGKLTLHPGHAAERHLGRDRTRLQ